MKIKLEDLLLITPLDRGFYITRKSYTNFYDCADAFYEDAATKYLCDKEVIGIESMNNKIHIILEDI